MTSFIRPTDSILDKNPLLNRIKPARNVSSAALFFKKLWAKIARYFSVKHPDVIRENLANFVRPTNLTVNNLWHHYDHFLKEDEACPDGLRKLFKQLEKDEKNILKIERMKSHYDDEIKIKVEAHAKFVKKTKKQILRMDEGKPRLLLLSEELFCTITRREQGYSLNFLGLPDVMTQFQDDLEVEGKKKVLRNLVFENIQEEEFIPFLETIVEKWSTKRDVITPHQVLSLTSSFIKKEPSSLDDYMTKANRPDKLFWNIVQSLPSENRPTTRASIRSIRLRTELLTLYEAFDKSRGSLNQKSKKFRDLKKLFEDVSGKVLLSYRKQYISEDDLRIINKRLSIIDDTLQKATSKPPDLINAKITLDKLHFDGGSLKNARIQSPLETTGNIDNAANVNLKDLKKNASMQFEATLSLNAPILLHPYASINDAEAYQEKLTEIYAYCDVLQNGNQDEKKWALNEVLRFFNETPFDLEWVFTPEDSREVIRMITELTEGLAEAKKRATCSEYDYQAIKNMRNSVVILNRNRTGICIDLKLYRSHGLSKVPYARDLRQNKDWIERSSRLYLNFYKVDKLGNPQFFERLTHASRGQEVKLEPDIYELPFRQQSALNKFFMVGRKLRMEKLPI